MNSSFLKRFYLSALHLAVKRTLHAERTIPLSSSNFILVKLRLPFSTAEAMTSRGGGLEQKSDKNWCFWRKTKILDQVFDLLSTFKRLGHFPISVFKKGYICCGKFAYNLHSILFVKISCVHALHLNSILMFLNQSLWFTLSWRCLKCSVFSLTFTI